MKLSRLCSILIQYLPGHILSSPRFPFRSHSIQLYVFVCLWRCAFKIVCSHGGDLQWSLFLLPTHTNGRFYLWWLAAFRCLPCVVVFRIILDTWGLLYIVSWWLAGWLASLIPSSWGITTFCLVAVCLCTRPGIVSFYDHSVISRALNVFESETLDRNCGGS